MFDLFPLFYYGADIGAGGGGVPAQGQGNPNPAQPAAAGQGPGAPQQQAGFNWGLFPNVPEDQRPVLEPHLKEVQGHTTRLEQQLAPFKPLIEGGYSPQDIQGVVRFSQEFDKNPLNAWLGMAQQLIQSGVIHDDLDFDQLVKVSQGQVQVEEEAPTVEGVPPQLQQFIQQQNDQIKQMAQELQQLKGGFQQNQQQTNQAVGTRMLAKTMETMRETLKGDGYPEDALTDRVLKSAIVYARGNAAEATKHLQEQRSGILKGFTNTRGQQPGQPTLPNGVPPSPKKTVVRGDDGWGEAQAGAADFLKRQNQASAQGT